MESHSRAESILRNAFIADAHFDLTYEVTNRRERGDRQVVESAFLPQLKKGGVDLVVSAIFIHDYFLPEMGLRRALDQIGDISMEMEESPGLFRICRTTTEITQARQSGELAVLLSLEGAEPLQNDLRLLPVFHQLGVRGLGLVWSRRNYTADGCFFADRLQGRKGGLTAFGVELVERAEQLGMYIDVSHLNDEGFWDLMEVATRPVIASHSNCRALAPTMRNLTDDQVKAVGGKGGLVCCNAVNRFLAGDSSGASVEDMVRHIDRMVSLTGIGHVGLGLDLCNSFQDHLRLEPAIMTSDVLSSHAAIVELVEALLRRGYTEHQVSELAGGNLFNFLERVLAR
jgi:membrane dipeptidase